MIEHFSTTHDIEQAKISISKISNTTFAEGPITRRITVTTLADSVTADFTEEGFALLKAILWQY